MTKPSSFPSNPSRNVIWAQKMSLQLPQLIVWLHLFVNNCWQNLRKPRSGPPPPWSLSHPIIQKSLGGSCVRSTHFPHLLSQPIKSHSLRRQRGPICSHFADFYTRVWTHVKAKPCIDCSNASFYFPSHHLITDDTSVRIYCSDIIWRIKLTLLCLS